MNTITLTKQALKALLTFAGKDCARANLCAIHVDARGTCYATDGHRALRVDVDPTGGTWSAAAMTIDRDALDAAYKIARAKDPIVVDVDARTITTASVAFPIVDAETSAFLWERLETMIGDAERDTRGSDGAGCIGVNPAYMADYVAMIRGAGYDPTEGVVLYLPSDRLSPILVKINVDDANAARWTSLLMPCKIAK